ncbi:1-acyl-sn-glycerol-3-phosphate acyltransferase [Amylolactobacillus amylotrophicus DSM 20534]|uniref:1-acyl-sn-glycerol-3-phosphate acyltransferase n=3 Tax=Amylolactobacillus TaxID=2767876 RepID=A0A1L6XA83_9LACO|nr:MULTISPECIES: 1-acyl-sn-glycerol-3-phosphate acyltransferase [Amylolactobacillus]APT17887.1 1-acyl-sn-glycerol-3-phosphate acyltransferase [Amylolactobacillus amylophilus DSM 20533 = JCM 1125]KRK38406.1 1-acyl-sn-glycerol-3-phosphate acyltransferase [Amylolactobacillus amylotrophicus DSM 20534]KRM42951.1 1-acyl-sn-glycerol-3-phosphate acyltransferase [Amylolactobacillus amylophilus DSM 20533 = JCM 1125]GED79818.1 1-acyl-sn-glycerol-3-phosphate acyltransferase [Amylolactobacillus amylophilus]
MFYKFIRPVARFVVWALNGHLHVYNKERIPNGNYILVAPHRTWWEPILFALAASPDEFMFMAKKELFKNPILRFILLHAHAFEVDRDNPGPSAIKIPVRGLKDDQLSLIIFPSGTRHSSELKSGAFVIAKLAKVPLLPAVYQGPLSFKGLLRRQPLKITFGEPIEIDRKTKVNDETAPALFTELEQAWAKIDQELDPSFKYISK